MRRRAPRANGHAAGTTLVELLVATLVTLVALATVLAVALPWTGGIHVLGEAADLQQRVRVAATSLVRAIHDAGSGTVVGAGARLPRGWPAVLPCVWSPGQPMCQPATDSVTVLGIADGLQVLLAEDMASPTTPLTVALPPGCADGQSACRLSAGANAAIVDASGARDEFIVTGVSAEGTLLTHAPATLSRAYRADAVVGHSTTEAFYVRSDAESGALELRSRRGSGDFPLLDGVVLLAFEYFGDPEPPAVLGVVDDRALVSYGPAPPRLDDDDPRDAWPAGENCTFAATTNGYLPRLSRLPTAQDGLARLSPALLGDGPWCPDEASSWRFDADVLRIRRVRVVLRLHAQSAIVRGRDPRLFARPGFARRADGLVPDMEVSVDVALLNPR